MAFVDDFIANLARDFRQIPNQTASNLNSVATGIAGSLISNGLTPLQLILAAQQTLVGFVSGETATDFPGRVNALAGLSIAIAPLAATTFSFGEINVGLLLYEAGFAVSGSAILATASTVLIPIAAGIVVGTVAQAYAETLQSYANSGAGYQLTTPTEQAGFSLIGMQYDADLALANTPDSNAVSSIITPGSVLTINLDPTLWHSTYGGNPPEGYAANDITGRTVLIEGLLGALSGTDGSESLDLIRGSLDPVVTEILVSNVSGAAISDAGVANAYNQSYGEAFILGNTAGSILTPTGNSFDAFIAQGQSNTIDFTNSAVNGSGANLVEMVNGGTLTIQAGDRSDCTVIWDPTGHGTIAINSATGSSVTVIEVDLTDVTRANFLAMNATQLASMFGPSIVIINPTANEHISFNGAALATPSIVDVPNPVYNPDLYNPGEPNYNLTPYFEEWRSNGLVYTADAFNDQPGFSFVSATLGDGADARSVSLFGFNNGDFGFSVPQSRTTFNLFTGAQGSLPTHFNGHVPLGVSSFISTGVRPQANTTPSTTQFGGVHFGVVDPDHGIFSVEGSITSLNSYSWLSSFVSVSQQDIDAPDGTFTFDTTTGHWSFTLDTNSAHFHALLPAESAYDTLSVHTLDGSTDTITVEVVAPLSNAFDVAQYLAQASQLTISVTITDTAANISAAFDQLNASTLITAITIGGSGPQVLTLSVAQATGDTHALGLITNANYQIAILDTAANIAGALQTLSSNTHVASISIAGPGVNTLSLSVAQALSGLHALALITPRPSLTLTDTAADLRALTPSQIATLSADGLSLVVATDAAAHFSTTQQQALGAAGVRLTEPYSGGQLATWTWNANGSVHDILYTNITGKPWDATDVVYGANGALSSETWTLAGVLVQDQTWNAAGQVVQRRFYSANGQVQTVAYANGVQVESLVTGISGQPWDTTDTLYSAATGRASSETWTRAGTTVQAETWNGDGSVHDIHTYTAGLINGTPYTDYDVLYGANGREVLRTYYNNGVVGEVISQTYTASNALSEVLYSHVPNAAWDTIDYLYDGSGHLQQTVWSNGGTIGAGGSFIQEQDYRSDGTVADRKYGPSASYSLLEYDYNAAGTAQILKNQTNLDGTHTITGLTNSVTLTSTTGINDTLTGGGTGETFVFNAGFGHDTVTDLATHLSGLGADTLQFQASAFSYLTGGMSQAQQVSAILAHATQDGTGAAVISDSAGDSVALRGVSLSQLTANAGVVRVV